MPRGKKSAAKKKKSDKEAVDAAEASSQPKVSDDKEPKPEDDVEEVEETLWDIVSVLKDSDRVCRTDECDKVAVATWATNTDPEDKWDLCEKCQENDFGGWPEGFHPEESAPEKGSKENTPTKEEGGEDKGAEPASNAPTPGNVSSGAPVDETSDNATTEEQKAIDETAIDGGSGGTEVEDQNPMEQVPPKEESPDPAEVTASENDKSVKENMDSDRSSSSDSGDEHKEDQENLEVENEGEEVVDGEAWDLKKVLTLSDLSKDCTIKCSTEECVLAACCIYTSSQAPTTKWYSCLDCQESDFGGWPSVEEIPITHLSVEHKWIMAEKCSSQKSPLFPKLPTGAAVSPKRENSDDRAASHTITPPPSSLSSTQARKKGAESMVTPSPAVTQSKNLLKAHRKWQEQAEAMGGPDARIVVSKPSAKKLIFDMLHDAFSPMNITQIHKELKAVVPSPILKSCLDEMVDSTEYDGNIFESDSEDEEKENKKSKKKKGDTSSDVPYAGSLAYKPGRNANTCLYYVDHTKLKNNGNGLEPEERNSLAADLMQAEAEQATLVQNLRSITAETAKLLSEPTNAEATASLETEEGETQDLLEKLEEARKLKVNEKHKEATKKSIEHMRKYWTKRKGDCMDFLIMLEESGAMSMKKIFAGEDKLELDSDEAVIAGAISYLKQKRKRGNKKIVTKLKRTNGNKGSNGNNGGSNSGSSGMPPSESFVGVRLDSSGKVRRVHVDDAGEEIPPQVEEVGRAKKKPRTAYC